MRKNRIYKTFMIPFLMVMMVFGFNTGAVLGDDDPGTDGPFKTRNGKFTLMHDDEIAGFAAPPEVSSTDHLVGWAFYPDEDLNLTEKALNTDALKMTNSDYDFGLPATAVGRMHTTDNDGIFVAYVDTDMYVRVAEYDPATGTQWISSKWSNAVMPKLTWGYGRGKYLDCATGDFDDDGVDELVVAYRDGNYPTLIVLKKGTGSASFDLMAKYKDTDIKMVWQRNLGVTTFHPFDGGDYVALAAEGPGENVTTFSTYIVGTNSITKDKSVTSKTEKSTGDNNSVDIAGGDFDGDGYDELVGIDSWESAALLDYDTDKNLVLLHRDGNSEPGAWLENHIATGDLDGDGDDEAVSACDLFPGDCTLALLVYDFDDTLAMTRKFYKKYQIDLQQTEDTIVVGAVDVAVGNFDGKKDIAMEVAVVYRTLTYHQISQTKYADWPTYAIQIYKATAGTLALNRKKESTYVIDQTDLYTSEDSCPNLVVAAGDFDGDSVVLGEPEHFQITAHRDFSAVILEPPKHIDYAMDNNNKWCELNVSRFGQTPGAGNQYFYTLYEDKSDQTITVSEKASTDYNWGVKVSAEEDTGFDFPDIASINVNVSASAEQTYNNRKETWNSTYSSMSFDSAQEAISDDVLDYTEKAIDVWRYPIVGETDTPTQNGKKGQLYLQMSFPSNVTKKGGISPRTIEWYQPVHQNGNILSYPQDIDQIDNINASDGTSGLLTTPEESDTGQTDETTHVNWSNTTSQGKEVSSQDKVAVDASVSIGGKIMDVDTNVTVESHYDQTWGTLNSAETTYSQSKGITIERTQIFEAYKYYYTPLIYKNQKTGSLQVGHTVRMGTKNIDSSWTWWNNNYGTYPDLALNLPFQWQNPSSDGTTWVFDTDSYNFNQMKGLFFLDSDGKPFGYVTTASGTCSGKEVNNEVTVKARIYNYSLVDVNQKVPVRFEYQTSTDGKSWGSRKAVSNAEISCETDEIPGFGNADKTPNWKYAAFTVNTLDAPLEGDYYYRFWVIVDPKNTIQERAYHDNGDQYANNTGYCGSSFYVQELTCSKTGSGESFPLAEVAVDDLSVDDETPVEGQEVLVSTSIVALGGDRSHVTVYFYEGHPDEGGKIFDLELIPYLKDDRPFTLWVPYHVGQGLGTREIFVVVEDDMAELSFTVIEKPWKDKIIDQLK